MSPQFSAKIVRDDEKICSSVNVSLSAADEWGSRSGTASDRRIIYTIDIDFSEDTSISMQEANDSSPRNSRQCSPRCVEGKKRENDDDDRVHRRRPIKGRFII